MAACTISLLYSLFLITFFWTITCSRLVSFSSCNHNRPCPRNQANADSAHDIHERLFFSFVHMFTCNPGYKFRKALETWKYFQLLAFLYQREFTETSEQTSVPVRNSELHNHIKGESIHSSMNHVISNKNTIAACSLFYQQQK